MASKEHVNEDEEYQRHARRLTPAQRDADRLILAASTKNAEHCINFDLEGTLNRCFDPYDRNWARSGLVIHAAAVVYGKKQDYVLDEGYAMSERLEKSMHRKDPGLNQVQLASQLPTPEIPVKRARARKLLDNEKLTNSYSFEVRMHKTMPASQIDENFQRQEQVSSVDSLKNFFGQQAEKGGKKGRLVLPKRFQLQKDQQAVNAKSTQQIQDYTKDDIGSRKDFAVFSYWIDSTTGELTRDINFKKHFNRIARSQRLESIDEAINNGYCRSERANSFDERNVDLPFRNFEEPLPGLRSPYDVIDAIDASDAIEKPTMDIPQILPLNPIIETPPPPTDSSIVNATLNDSTLSAPKEVTQSLEDLPVKNPKEPTQAVPNTASTMKEYSIIDVTDKEIAEINRNPPSLNIVNLKSISPKLSSLKMLQTLDMCNFRNSIIPIKDKILANSQNFVLPAIYHAPTIKYNLLGVPLKKLTRGRIFELPKYEYGKLMERKKNQHKPTVAKPPAQTKMYKLMEVPSDIRSVCSNVSVHVRLLDFAGIEAGIVGEEVDVGNGLKVVEDTEITNQPLIANNDESQTVLPAQLPANSGNEAEENIEKSAENNLTNCQNISEVESGYESCFNFSKSSQNLTSNSTFNSTVPDAPRVDLSEILEHTDSFVNNLVDDINVELSEDFRKLNDLDDKSKREMDEWKMHLRPILQSSKSRNDFLVDDYQQRVIDKIEHIGNSKTLAELTEKPDFARYFLTTLFMVNSKNVSMEISQPDRSVPVDPQSIKIKLHSTMLHSQTMEGISETLSNNKRCIEQQSSAGAFPSSPKKQKLMESSMKRKVKEMFATSTPLTKRSRPSFNVSAINQTNSNNDVQPSTSRGFVSLSQHRDLGYESVASSPLNLLDEAF